MITAVRNYKGVCNVRQCVFYFRDREKSQKTLVKAEQLTPGGGGLPYETDGDARRKF